jgi:hypothetical protein
LLSGVAEVSSRLSVSERAIEKFHMEILHLKKQSDMENKEILTSLLV